MNDLDWDFDHYPPRGTDVRRRLTLDHRSYDVTAFDDGSGVVGLRMVGWDSGYVFTELVAELPTGDATDVGQLLASALAGFRGAGSPPASPPPGRTFPSGPTFPGGWLRNDRRSRPTASKSGQPWEPADLELLVRRFREGASVQALTVELERTEGAVRQRLQILGEVRPGQAPDGVLPTDGALPTDGMPEAPTPRWDDGSAAVAADRGDGSAAGRGDGLAAGRGDGLAAGQGDGLAADRGDRPAVSRGDGPAVSRGDGPAAGRGDIPVAVAAGRDDGTAVVAAESGDAPEAALKGTAVAGHTSQGVPQGAA